MKQIAEALGIELPSNDVTFKKKIISEVPKTYEDFTNQLIENKQKDYIAVRDNLLNLISDFQQIFDVAVDEARANPSARLIEAFSSLSQTYASINKDLLSISDVKESNAKETKEDKTIVNNAIFVGTTDSLIEQIRKQVK